MKGGKPIFIENHSKIGILMIHGFSSTPDEFRELSLFLSGKGFTVYAPLVAGHGTKPDDLSKTTYHDWTKSVEDAYVKLRQSCEKVFLIGNSFGSNLSFWLATRFEKDSIGIITLDAPIFLRDHFLTWLRLHTYGFFKKYYKKPPRLYQADYIDMMDEITYPMIPIKSLREFWRFIRRETVPSLPKVKIPTLITHSSTDPIIHPRSATYIYNYLGSPFKRIHWFVSNNHAFTVDGHRIDVFHKIFNFINEVTESLT